jgi:glucosamine 6-phosphate synthetase-like amidotransferase/phosphosugar isomerase protein
MCGVFGFIARKAGARPNLHHLERLAEAAEFRGDHAYGLAWIENGTNRLRMHKAPGGITGNLDTLKAASDCTMLIGHTRWATHGSASDNANNHPHACDGGWIVHNGVVTNDIELIDEFNHLPVSECDSEVIGLTIESLNGSLMERSVAAINRLKGSHVVLGLWTRPNRMLVVRRGNPLSIEERDEGFYFCSIPCYMKNDQEIRDSTARILTVGNINESGVRQSVKGLDKCRTAKMDLWKTFEEPKTGARRSVKVSSILKGKVKWSHARNYDYEANDDGTGSWVVK